MRKQSGFTLIELMVVMAIIAILATAGLSSYGGYLKKARDSTRISDLRAIESVVLASLGSNGLAPTLATLKITLAEMNNGVLLKDPLVTKSVCIGASLANEPCKYEYFPCDNFMGYIIKIRFEDIGNRQGKSNGLDDLATADGHYEIGKCTVEMVAPDGGFIE